MTSSWLTRKWRATYWHIMGWICADYKTNPSGMVWRLNQKTCQNSGKIIHLNSKSAARFVSEITWHLIILEAAPVIQCLRTTTPAMMYVVCTCKPCSKPFWQTWLDIRLTTWTAIIHRQCICSENRSKMAKHPNLQMHKEGCFKYSNASGRGTCADMFRGNRHIGELRTKRQTDGWINGELGAL